MKNTPEQLLSFAENELMKKESIRRAVLREATQKQKQPIVWTKILLPIAACLVLALGTVFLIPSARAEVLRWLRIERPEQYLTEDPEERTPVEALDELIIPAETETPNRNRITFVSDEPIWQQIASDFRIDIGDTMFDGSDLYITVTLHGLTALPELDAYTGGSITQTAYPADAIAEYFEDGKVPEEYTSGKMTFMEPSWGHYYLKFADGSLASCGQVGTLEANPEIVALFDKNYDEYGEDPLSDADREAISRESIEWLKNKSLVGVVRCWAQDEGLIDREGSHLDMTCFEYFKSQANENGIVTAELIYVAKALDPDQSRTLLEADLGTVRFNIDAVNRLKQDALTAKTPSVVFGPQQVKLSYTEWIKTDYDDSTFAVTNLPADLNGLMMEVENGGFLDALGVHGICIRAALPESWSDEMCKAFKENTRFICEIDGKRYSVSTKFDSTDAHTLRYTIDTTEFPYDRFDSIKEIRVIPELDWHVAMLVGEQPPVELQDNARCLQPDTNENISFRADMMILTDGIFVFTRSK